MLVVLICISNILHLPASSSYRGIGAHALIYINPLSRLFEFCLGIMACGLFHAVKPQAEQLSFTGASLIELFVFALMVFVLWLIALLSHNEALTKLIGEAGMVWFKSSGGAIFFFILIVVFALQKGFLSTVLQMAILVILGEVSFSLYLVHTIVLKYFDAQGLFAIEWSYQFYWLMSIIIAYLIFRAIEMPSRAFLLRWVRREALPDRNRFGAIQAMSECFRARAFWQFCLLVGIIIIAGQLKISTLITLDKDQLNKKLDVNNLLTHPVPFSDGLDLLYVSKILQNDSVKLAFIWCAQKQVTLNQHVGLHFLDYQSGIVGQADYLLDKSQTAVDRGACFTTNTSIPEQQWREVVQLGVALYVDEKHLNEVHGGQTDWDHHRLLIPLQGQKK